MDALVMLVALGALVGVWFWLARTMRNKGRGWFIRHLAGSFAGSFAFMLLVMVAVGTGLITAEPKEENAGTEVAAVTPDIAQSDVAYSITKDETTAPFKRTVEVALDSRIREADLQRIAEAIKAEAKQKTDRTFIGYRIEGKTTGAYWATTHYDPTLKVVIQGLSIDEHKSLSSIDLSGYQELVGHWIRDGALGHLMVLYKKDGNYFIDSFFADGSRGTTAYVAKGFQGAICELKSLRMALLSTT